MPANRLAQETSPYLLQHAHNPVDWYAWGEEALHRAREEDRPILLSVGYAACHWCHVMERESFENEKIAAVMNRHFVCVKVDREERPDIDQLYMSAVQAMTRQGGWPMTVFLTPDGLPFYGGTYFPPDDRYGRPGFLRVLEAVAEAWRERRDAALENAASLAAEIRRAAGAALAPSMLTQDVLERAVTGLRRAYDERMGGFGDAPKFPQPMILDFLLRYAARTKRDEPLRMATFTLERMALGGICDQVGGGFHRYSTDAYWLVPHFEKMLYDNAQLSRTYLRAWQATGDAFFREICERTLDYVLREMTAPLGGFYSAQDADSEGEEGRFFVWTVEQIREALGDEDAPLAERYFDITPRGNWEGRSIPNITAPPETFARSIGMDPSDFAARLASIRERLLARRSERVPPATDDKVVVAWDGLVLAAFAEAAAALDRADYLAAASRAASFLLDTMIVDGRLMRTGREADGVFRVAPIPAFLADHACLADGLLSLYEAAGDRAHLDAARRLLDAALDLFAGEDGLLYDTGRDAETLLARPREISDNAVPSGASAMAMALLRLAALTGEPAYEQAAAKLLRPLVSMMGEHFSAFGALLCAADRFLGPARTVAIAGSPEDPRTRALLAAARSGWRPNVSVAFGDANSTAGIELFDGRGPIDGAPAAYVCEGASCLPPVTDPADLARVLGR